jgi:hypothetical protein
MLFLQGRVSKTYEKGYDRRYEHWDVDKFHKVANEAHDSKSDGDGFTDLSEF